MRPKYRGGHVERRREAAALARRKREDAAQKRHTPSKIVPADYRELLVYQYPRKDDQVQFGVDCRMEGSGHSPWGRCCAAKLREEFGSEAIYVGRLGVCGVCGARFKSGSLWQHVPTGNLVHVGHQCVAKYEMLTDATLEELAEERRARAKDKRAQSARKAKAEAERAALLREHPTLRAFVEGPRPKGEFLVSLWAQARTTGTLSERQVSALLETLGRKKEAESYVAAPTGVQEFTGTVVSVKEYSGAYGSAWKMTLRVDDDRGTWMAFGTVPKSLLKGGAPTSLKGKRVRVKATLKPGRDPYFALLSRPRATVTD